MQDTTGCSGSLELDLSLSKDLGPDAHQGPSSTSATPTLLSPDFFRLLPPASFQVGHQEATIGTREIKAAATIDMRESTLEVQTKSQEDDLLQDKAEREAFFFPTSAPLQGTDVRDTPIRTSETTPTPQGINTRFTQVLTRRPLKTSRGCGQSKRWSLNNLDDDDDDEPLPVPATKQEIPQKLLSTAPRRNTEGRERRVVESLGKRDTADGQTLNDAVLAQLLQDDEYCMASYPVGGHAHHPKPRPLQQSVGAVGRCDYHPKSFLQHNVGAVGGRDHHQKPRPPQHRVGPAKPRSLQHDVGAVGGCDHHPKQHDMGACDPGSDRLLQEQRDAELALMLQSGNGWSGGEVGCDHHPNPAPSSEHHRMMSRQIQEQKDAELASKLQSDNGWSGTGNERGRRRDRTIVLLCEMPTCLACSGSTRVWDGEWSGQGLVGCSQNHPVNQPPREAQQMDMSYESLLELEDVSRGVDKITLSHMTSTHTYTERKGVNKEERCCAVCLTEYCEGQLLRTLPCVHTFHEECVDKWLKTNPQCPICMEDIKDSSALIQDTSR